MDDKDFDARLAKFVEKRTEEILTHPRHFFPPDNAHFPSELGPAYTAILIATAEFLLQERERSFGEPCMETPYLNSRLFRALWTATDIVFTGSMWSPKEN